MISLSSQKLNYWLIIFLGIMAVIQVVMLNRFSTIGETLTRTNEKIENLERENSQLRERIASSSSILLVKEKAQKLGLRKMVNITSFVLPIPVAYQGKPAL